MCRTVISKIDEGTLALLLKTRLFEGLPKETVLEICRAMKPVKKEFKKEAIVLAEGDDASRIGLILSGKVCATKLTGDGDTHILAMHEPGELMGLDGALTKPCLSPLTFTALEKSEILFLDIRIILTDELEAAYSNRLLKNVNRMLADKCVRLLYKAEVLSKRSLRVRIMTYLRIQQRKQQRNTIMLKMDREQFAQYLCVNRSALSRELSAMRRDGLITIENDGSITIGNPDF